MSSSFYIGEKNRNSVKIWRSYLEIFKPLIWNQMYLMLTPCHGCPLLYQCVIP